MNHRTPQNIYASNLLRVQSFGYPLRNPKPKDKFDPEGFRIGDVGYVDDYGKFNCVFNISFLPKELLKDDIQSLPLDQPASEEHLTLEKSSGLASDRSWGSRGTFITV